MNEGIYFNLPEDEYHAAPGLSNSAMKDLYVSPLNFWDKHINPEPPEREETSAQTIGKALHCRLLEPVRFRAEYVRALDKGDYVDLLDTQDNLKTFCRSNDLPVSGNKGELINRIHAAGHNPLIWEELKTQHEKQSEGKVVLKPADYDLIEEAAGKAMADPLILQLLKDGFPEVSIFVEDEGVMLKCRIDYLRVGGSVDLKTFNNSRGKPAQKAIFESLYYEGYYIQAAVYHYIRELARVKLAAGEIKAHDAPEGFIENFIKAENHIFGLVFVESSRPFHLDVRILKPNDSRQSNLYWTTGLMRLNDMKQEYQECLQKWGKEEWREPCQARDLSDLDMPQLIFS